jgi:O-antigen ligase
LLVERFQGIKKFKVEAFLLLIIFSLSWLGFGVYIAGLLVLGFLGALFFKERREFMLSLLKDKPFILLLILFTLNNIISSLFSIDKLVSTTLSCAWFLLIFIPLSYVRFSINNKNDFFIKAIVPAAFFISIIIFVYLLASFFNTLFTQGLTWKKYTFYFLSAGSTPDMILMLAGIGYGWIVQKEGEKNRWLGFLYLILCFVGIVLSRDRGSAIALFILALIVLSFDYKRLIVFLVIVAAVLLLSVKVESLSSVRYLYSFLYDRMEIIGLIQNTQIASFRTAWDMIKDHWLLGVGTNNFWTFSDMYGWRKFAYAHNIVLQFWAENGLFGMIFGLGIIGLVIYRWLKSFKLYRYKHIALGMGASFIAMLIGQLTNSTIWAFQSAIPFWLLVGAINAIFYVVRDQE